MCTVSWSLEAERLSLGFNRDERKSRSPAQPPEIEKRDGVVFVAPRDPVGGGTWIAANEFGLCLFLLNNYDAAARRFRSDARSRGEIPLALAASRTHEGAMRSVAVLPHHAFNPFIVGIASPLAVALFSWDGEVFRRLDTELSMYTTSSFRSEEVQAYRIEEYKKRLKEQRYLDSEQRFDFHTGKWADDPAFAPMMLRQESRTHSYTEVDVSKDWIQMKYFATLGDSRTLEEASVSSLERCNS